ncbi:stage II sporulation protein D [Paenibacillus oryzae]|uniref:stage II sporulation protein D n=1 Tax=Paenibacillus oryzae TaxID=1844972 RepID=UPI000B0E6672|nr:stage II sporulation protein D [Paenibacillus oryzae]
MSGKQWSLLFMAGILLGGVVFGMEGFLSKLHPGISRGSEIGIQQNAGADNIPSRSLASASGGQGLRDEDVRERAGAVAKEQVGPSEPVTTGDGAEDGAGSEGRLQASEKPAAAKPLASGAAGPLDKVQVKVYLSAKKKVEKVPLETYVLGVLAGEMTADFELEALKAQAIAARTYIVRKLSSASDEALKKKGADVTNTIQHQVYIPRKELLERWPGGADAEPFKKLEQAVAETRGLIITYNGGPIEAAFFSTSNGYTENSEEYWELQLPYLRSVASPWDKELSPRYKQQTELRQSELYAKLGLSGKAAKGKPVIKLVSETEGNRVKEVKINGVLFTGREVREKLGLASSQFTWKIDGKKISFTTYGMGHGVGMSQWGANGMAKEGKTAVDILQHYYSGASIVQASKLPMTLSS